MKICDRPPYQKRQRPVVSPPLRNASRGAACTLRIPSVCTGDTSTVIGAHLRQFNAAGMGQKPHDLHLVDACAACHAALDDRSRWAELAVGYDDLLRALMETQNRRVAAGLITVRET